jgi:hypothetical protein
MDTQIQQYIDTEILHKNINTVGYITNIIGYDIVDFGKIVQNGQIECIIDIEVERYILYPKDHIITQIKGMNNGKTGYLTTSHIPIYIDKSSTNRILKENETINVEIASVSFSKDKFIVIGTIL